MGGILGAVLPDGGGLYLHAGDVQFHDGGQLRVAGIGDKYEHRQAADAFPQGHFVQQTNDLSGLVVGPFRGNVILLSQLFNEQRGGNVGIQTVHPVQVGLEIVLPDGILLVQGIGKGTFLRNGKMLRVLDTDFLALLDQPQQIVVGTLGGKQYIVVDGQVIAGPVAHQKVTVFIHNIAPGGFYTGQGGKGFLVVGFAAGFDDLQVVEL